MRIPLSFHAAHTVSHRECDEAIPVFQQMHNCTSTYTTYCEKRTVEFSKSFESLHSVHTWLNGTHSSAHYNQYLHIIWIFDAYSAFGFGNWIWFVTHSSHTNNTTEHSIHTNANDFLYICVCVCSHNAPHPTHQSDLSYVLSISQTLPFYYLDVVHPNIYI